MKEDSNFDFSEKLKIRTKLFAVKRQLIRSATSVAANYRAAVKDWSKAEFY